MAIESAPFTIAADADDRRVIFQDATYPPTTLNANDPNFCVARRAFYSGSSEYAIENGLLRWDTASIPSNASVLSATLFFTIAGGTDTDNRSLVADWYAWDGTASDFSATALTTAIPDGLLPLSGFDPTVGIPLTNSTPNVNKSGYTSLRFHITGGVPTGDNTIGMYSWPHNVPANLARLVVSYDNLGQGRVTSVPSATVG